MKRILVILTGLLLISGCSRKPDKAVVTGTILIAGKTQPDSFFVGLYHIAEGEQLSRPEFFSASIKPEFSLKVDPGKYLLAAYAFGYETYREPIFIADCKTKIEAKISLVPFGIKPDIKLVKLYGEFGQWMFDNAVPMKKEGSAWVLKNPSVIKKGQQYKFMVDSLFVCDLNNPKHVSDMEWTTFNNVYDGGPVLFNPELYEPVRLKSSAELAGLQYQKEFKGILADLKSWENDMYAFRGRMRKSSLEEKKQGYSELDKKLGGIEKKYPPPLNQMVLEKRISALYFLNPVLNEMYETAYVNGKLDTAMASKMALSDAYVRMCRDQLALMNQLDPKSYFIEGDFAQAVYVFGANLEQYPELAKTMNVDKNYCYDFIVRFVKNCPNKKVCASVLFTTGFLYAREEKVEKATYLIGLLKKDYADEFYVGKGHADKVLASLKTVKGAEAPDFRIKTLAGDSLQLSKLRGKFVLVDFWGSWCGPCRGEVPNFKKLYETVSKDTLQMIGIAEDDSTALVKFIQEQKIPYPNAIGTKNKVMVDYGITAFPTTLLVSPDGKIFAKELRGVDLVKLVRDNIREYYKNLQKQ
jgi:peroxiredoxin